MPHDELAATNRARWNDLVDAGVEFSRPMLDLTPQTARAFVDEAGLLGDVTARRVLCLAGGGGQQSAAFALLGADVTVADLSDRMLDRDREAAAHYGFTIHTVQADMRDLSVFADHSFDIVYHAFSINFVPSVAPVLAEVARVLRPGGFYRIQWANPFVQTIDPEKEWTGEGYLLRHEYVDGRDLTALAPNWTIYDDDGSVREIAGPQEYVHSLSSMINGLAANRFVVRHAAEDMGSAQSPAPGSWGHYMRVAPPYLTLWARLLPAAFA